jgi:hypothetical protein
VSIFDPDRGLLVRLGTGPERVARLAVVAFGLVVMAGTLAFALYVATS